MDNLLIPSTFNKLSLLTIKGWSYLGMILPAIFLEMQVNEPRSDFRCDVKDDIDKDFMRGKCFNLYQKQNNKLGVPLYAFIMVNVLVIPVVSVIYSQCVKSIVRELECRRQDDERTRSRRLFLAYFCQLTVSCALRIIFIAFLEIELFYPRTFPEEFSCSIKGNSVGFLPMNQTKSANSVQCITQRAADKNFWIETVEKVNATFAFFAFLEILWILSRAKNGIKFMYNWDFYADHLKSNSAQLEAMALVQPQHQPTNAQDYAEQPDNSQITMLTEHPEQVQAQKDLQSAVQALKDNSLWHTEKPSDLKQPFGRSNPGEGDSLDLTMDEIYVNVAIHEGRAHHYFANQDRAKQLKEYPPNAKDCRFEKPEDILDENHKNVLVVGRPGIGKTSLSTKVLRLWASGEAFNAAFNVVFLVKFRRFNGGAKLSLRELLASAETVQRLDDSVWEFVQNESTKVLLIFDGLDEYSRKEEISTHEDYKNDVEEIMPVSVLYKKLATGELLRGASILVTTRPTAVKYVAHSDVKRTVEIRGFTSENVEEYVEKFTRGYPGAKEKILGHIKSNINLFSLSYIPVNCFLICHCLLQSILCESSQLPTRMTDIYQMTVKMILFNHMHNREGFPREELENLRSTHMYEPFENFPEELQKIFNKVGEIALKGIAEGRLLFESSEVSGLEDCGLLHKLPDLKPKAWNYPRKSQFCFLHLTVQEFFAAKHLVNTKTKEEIERFVCDHIKHGTWQVVLQFVAGLLNSSRDIFIKLLPSLSEGTWPAKEDKDLAVQVCKCLYEINDEQQPVLQNKLGKMKFNRVDFNFCSLAPIDVAAVLYFLRNAEEVLKFHLFDNQLGDLGANEVKKFIVNRERKLKELNLTSNNLTDNAAKDFAAALKHSKCGLEKLDLTQNKFTDNAAKDFAAALEHSNCKLEKLELSNNNFTDNAAKDFAAALKHSNCKLEKLELSNNNFTDNAAKDFAAALEHSNCKLETLELNNNNFTDNAAKDFAAALEHSNCKLGSLFLNENNFTDNAAMDFAAALKHSNCKLKELYLSNNNFTKEGRRYLTDAEKQSNCRVTLL
ncbi:nucleotide-binding oligomerization domain-containing protein 2-like [Acropora millepora]|uniref:nucleotide-binding oligomerization domain-containing protein 2-like n=1 Tax=Acropora millepora TaxID=45264 RepID=UPI001CF15B22|nr:nucleotide-binding oligomerization domain-containing protein 2-like [Acropora millepora]